MKKIAFFLYIIGVLPIWVNAQSTLLKNADTEFKLKDYGTAIQLYEKLLKQEKDAAGNLFILKRLGDSYEELNNYKEALTYYDAYLTKTGEADFDFFMKYYEVLLKLGQVSKARVGFSYLNAQVPDNQQLQRMINCCNYAADQLAIADVPPIVSQDQLNSNESEFGLAFYEDQLIFASQRIGDDYSSIHGRTNEGFSDLYAANYDDDLKVYTNPLALPGKINTSSNEGVFTLHKPTTTAYFSQCKRNGEECKILRSALKKEKWNTPDVIYLGGDSYNYAHPAFNSDCSILYFSSDLPGGYGGKDIWKVSVSSSGIVGTPQNLGSVINTDRNEMFPSVAGDSILFFASEGHVGMGGLDIFYSKINKNVFEQAINLGTPINSTYDDFSILLNSNSNGGYFCSNRNYKEGSDDIFEFYHDIFVTDISGIVFDSIQTFTIPNAKIEYQTNGNTEIVVYTDSVGHFKLPFSGHSSCPEKHTVIVSADGYNTRTVDVQCHGSEDLLIALFNNEGLHSLKGNVTDIISDEPIDKVKVVLKSTKGKIDTVYTDKLGNYRFYDIPSNDYLKLSVSKDGYLKDSKNFLSPDDSKTICMEEKTHFATNFDMYPIQEEVEFTIENIYYEFNKSTLLPASTKSLDKLVNLLLENHKLKIKINSHTDDRGSNEYNMGLSERRGQSVVRYLLDAGISSIRLRSEGKGETQLAVQNAKTEYEHQKNRRTTFEILDEKALRSSDSYRVVNVTPAINNKTNTLVAPATRPSNKKMKVPQEKIYRIQLLATESNNNVVSSFDSIRHKYETLVIHKIVVNSLTKYQLGDFTTREEAEKVKVECRSMGFADCFITIQTK